VKNMRLSQTRPYRTSRFILLATETVSRPLATATTTTTTTTTTNNNAWQGGFIIYAAQKRLA
jgi:hypothetical protein